MLKDLGMLLLIQTFLLIHQCLRLYLSYQNEYGHGTLRCMLILHLDTTHDWTTFNSWGSLDLEGPHMNGAIITMLYMMLVHRDAQHSLIMLVIFLEMRFRAISFYFSRYQASEAWLYQILIHKQLL